jgi:TrpR-related protein YerC/YecD
MAKYIHKKKNYDEQDRLLDELCEVLQILKTTQEKKYFLKDLLGRGERIMLVRRFKVAKLLEQGKTYKEIRKKMGAGYSTITRVERLLNFGRGGYRKAIAKMLKKGS